MKLKVGKQQKFNSFLFINLLEIKKGVTSQPQMKK